MLDEILANLVKSHIIQLDDVELIKYAIINEDFEHLPRELHYTAETVIMTML